MTNLFDSIFKDAANVAKNTLKSAQDTVGNVAETLGSAVNDAISATGEGLDNARKIAVGAAANTANAVGSAANNAISAVNQGIEDQRRKAQEERQRELDEAEAKRQANIASLEFDNAKQMLDMLESSPIPLTQDNVTKIKACFPIPREHAILWADAEFDLRPSGIVITNVGVFFKSDAVIFANPFAKEDEQCTSSSLSLIAWEYFDPECFTIDDSGNYALSVDKECAW